MRVDVRPVGRLRGKEPLDVTAALGPVIEALCASEVDLSRVSVVCDWIQYRSSFREVADCRPVLAPWHGEPMPDGDAVDRAAHGQPPAEAALEMAIDLRRCGDTDLRTVVAALLREHADPASSTRVPLEPWAAGRQSCIWRFNALYWQALSLWEQATGRDYEQALPGGESDARNTTAVRELILELFKTWDDLDSRNALPAELYVAELGVGNGNQARTWLDEFVELSQAHRRDYYRRLQYIMGDYSPHVLGRAMKAVAHHGDHVSALVVDATRPAVSLGFLRGKAFLVYISNVYDNLPSDELPQHFSDAGQAVTFWRDVWAALRLQERYRPLEGLDMYQVSAEITGELLRSQLESHGDIRVHVNNGALSSFAQTLPLLHPYGRLQCHDLFLDDVLRYHSGFFGPGKYDGSVVNWVNGPLLRHIGGRAGFDVRISPFAARPSSNVKTLTAGVRE
jgi:hypothetical protein